MKTPSRFVYRVEGVMSYRVELRETGQVVGWVQRTRDGWDARLAGWGNRDGELVVEDYPGSRETAAGVLLAAFNDNREAQS